MNFAEWSGKSVAIYTETRTLVRRFSVDRPIISVQCGGEGDNAQVAITMDNGKTSLYRWNGQIIRRG